MEIKFKEVTTFLGRNGEFKSTGIVLGKLGNSGEVLIEPITSRGVVGRCYIAVPKESIKELAEELLKLTED